MVIRLVKHIHVDSDTGAVDRIKDGSSSESEVDDKTKKRKPNERKVRNFEKEDFSHSGFTQIGKGGKPKEFTTETLYTRLKEILDARGKKVN